MSDIDLRVALMESGRMNLMHLPAGAISWLWDRPTKQIDAAESLAVAANAHGNPVVDASLLKADQNVLLIKCEGGECFRIYPDGGFSHNDSPMDIGGCSSVLQGMQQNECPMDDNGHQMDAGADMPMGGMPMDMPMDMPMGMPMVMGESQKFKDAMIAIDRGVFSDDSETAERAEAASSAMVAKTITPQELTYWTNREEDYNSMREGGGGVGLGSDNDPWGDNDAEDYSDDGYGERSEPELDRQTNYDAPPYRDGDDSYDEGIGNDEHMDAEAPESGVATPVGMTNLAGEPTMDESEGGLGASAMGGMGTGTPYVGDISMDADPEMENLMMSRELGEASIHMFRNESDEDLDALSAALGITEMNDYDDDVENIKLEVYDESLDTYQDVPITVEWSVEPSEFDGQFQSYQGSASVDKMQLAKPVQVNGKVYRQLDDELSGLILATHNSGHTSLYDYVGDEYSGKIEIPQHKYPDSTR